MPPIPKQPRQVNGIYLEFLRDQPCSVCRKTIDIVSHHTITRGAFGSDYWALPACLDHHLSAHILSMDEWAAFLMPEIHPKLERNPKIMAEIIKNLIKYIEHLTLKQEGMTCQIPCP